MGAVMAGVLTSPVLADPGASATEKDGDVARLEALLEAQQAKIDQLEQQVAATALQDMDAARTEQMKDQIREVLSEREFRESLMPSMLQAGYDNGFFIRSSDDKFKMTFRGLVQFRWTYYNKQPRNRYLLPGFSSPDRNGFDGNRIRFIIGGHAYTKDLTYSMTLDFSEPTNYNARLLYGWVNYRFMDEMQLRAGIFRLASTRQDFESTATMQFAEYAMENIGFGLGRGIGVRLWGELMEGKGYYWLDVVNQLNGTGRTMVNDEDLYAQGHDGNPAIVFRTVWQILGGSCIHPEDEGTLTSPCDMAMHDSPAWNVGFHYAFNADWRDGSLAIAYPRRTFWRAGGFGNTNSSQLNIHQFGFDTGFKWMGFSATAEYWFRTLDVRSSGQAPLTPLYQATGDDSTNVQHGGYLQCGYFLPIPGMEQQLELVGRIGGLVANSSQMEGVWMYAGGLNYYIDGHNVKIQTDLTKVYEAPYSSSTYSLANVNDDAWIWRVQLQVLF
jgi:hypothetical protein